MEVSKSLCQVHGGNHVLARPFVNQTLSKYCNQLDDVGTEIRRKNSLSSSGNLSILVLAAILGGICSIMGVIAVCFWRLRIKHYKKRNINERDRSGGVIAEGEEQKERLASNEGGGSVDLDEVDDDEKKHFDGFVRKQISRSMLSCYCSL